MVEVDIIILELLFVHDYETQIKTYFIFETGVVD